MATWFDESVLRPEVAGLVGGVLGLFNTPGEGIRERAFNLGAGIGAAWFLAPALEDYLDVSSKNGQMAVAFVVGLVGMNLLAKIVSHVRRSSLFNLLRAPAESPEQKSPSKERKK